MATFHKGHVGSRTHRPALLVATDRRRGATEPTWLRAQHAFNGRSLARLNQQCTLRRRRLPAVPTPASYIVRQTLIRCCNMPISLLEFTREWMRSRLRIAAMAVGLGAVLLYEIARAYYRPYIYSNAIDDFHIADTLGNSLGTIATVYVMVSIFGRVFEQGLFVLRATTVSVVVYELLHPLLGKPIDPGDIVATLLAGVASEMVFRSLRSHLQPATQKSAD